MTKKSSEVFFQEKRRHRSVAVPGDTNPSDATADLPILPDVFTLRNSARRFLDVCGPVPGGKEQQRVVSDEHEDDVDTRSTCTSEQQQRRRASRQHQLVTSIARKQS